MVEWLQGNGERMNGRVLTATWLGWRDDERCYIFDALLADEVG